MIFQKRKKKIARTEPTITTEALEDLPYADNFDLPREEAKLRAVYEHDQMGGNFDIRKVFGSKGMRARTITTVAHFPAYNKVEDIVEEHWGGGTYNIHPAGSPRVFKTYYIDGPPRYGPEKPPREKSAVQKLKEELDDLAVQQIREMLADDPEMQRLFAMAVLKKQYGIERPPEESWNEKLFREGVQSNPEYKDLFVQAGLRERGVEFPEEVDPFEQELRNYERVQRLIDLFEEKSKGPTGTLARIWKDVAPALPEIVKMFRELRGTGTAGQVGPALEAPPDQRPAQIPIEHVPSPMVPPVQGGQAATPSPPPEPDPAPVDALEMPSVEQPEDRPIDQAHSVPLLSRVDWAELETGVHGDPGEFMQGVYISAFGEASEYHQQLARLFCDYEPEGIMGELSRLVEAMTVESGKGEEYEVAVLVLKQLAESETGRLWLDQAHLAAKIFQGKLDEHSAGKVVDYENGLTDGGGEGVDDSPDEDEYFNGTVLI